MCAPDTADDVDWYAAGNEGYGAERGSRGFFSEPSRP